jgi:hypothetical protein
MGACGRCGETCGGSGKTCRVMCVWGEGCGRGLVMRHGESGCGNDVGGSIRLGVAGAGERMRQSIGVGVGCERGLPLRPDRQT